MAEPRKVVIDGQVYLPAREIGSPLREAVARAIGDLYYGGLGVNWEDAWNRECAGRVRIVVTDGTSSGISGEEFLDQVIAHLVRRSTVDSVPTVDSAPLGYNGGVACDMKSGPCACGAWH